MSHELRPFTTVAELVQWSCDHFADVEALVDRRADGQELRMSFTALGERIDGATRAVIGSGVGRGDRVGIWAPNIWEWVVASLGVLSAGGVVVPINTRFKGAEAAYVLERAQARLLFTVTDFLDLDRVALLRDASPVPSLEQIVVMRGEAPTGTVGWDAFLARGDEVDDAVVSAARAAITPQDLSLVMFTSGTTGMPKGAMLEHGALLRGFTDWSEIIGLRRGDRYLIVNPFFHMFGLGAGFLACLMVGATIVPHPVFDVSQVMARVVEERITVLPGPPAIYQTILNHPDLASFDFSTVRLAATGAASIPVELIVAMRDVLGFETVVTGYGLTEGTGLATMCRAGDDPKTIATTSGRAMPDMEVVAVDDDGRALAPGEQGEIWVRGYNVMRGYLDDPEQTAEAVDVDGWLHTGDIGVLDERGYIQITDRKKDMFIVGGFNAYPAEIESILGGHPGIAQVAVVGVPDQRLGEVGVAFVVPVTGAQPEPDQIIAWSREVMANYKVPRQVHLVDALPLNASNKVLKFELRERANRLIPSGE